MIKNCKYCNIEFEDTSRAKNKQFCSTKHQGQYRWLHKKDQLLAYNKEYEKNNKESVRTRKNIYRKKKYKEDINFAIGIKLRIRLKRAIKSKLNKNDILLGCSIEDFKKHLESKFLPGMSWDNYGKWEIDHLKPLTDFDLSKESDLLNACNYSNMKPIWKKLNRIKSNKKLVYLIVGAPGAGKSWILSKLNKDKYEVLDRDKIKLNEIVILAKTTNKIPVIALTIGISTFIENNKDLHCQLLVINEELTVLNNRIVSRGGSITTTIEKRYKRMISLSKEAIKSGSSQEILDYLS